MQTNNLTSSLSKVSVTTIFGSINKNIALAISIFLVISITSVDFAVAADSIAYQEPDSPRTGSIDDFAINNSIPNLPQYQFCLSQAMKILNGTANFGNSDCNDAVDVRFCIKQQFILGGSDCALYL